MPVSSLQLACIAASRLCLRIYWLIWADYTRELPNRHRRLTNYSLQSCQVPGIVPGMHTFLNILS